MSNPSELREAIYQHMDDESVTDLIGDDFVNRLIDKTLDAVIASLPDTKQPGTYNALLNPEIYGYIKAVNELRELLQSAKSISKESPNV